MRLGRGIWLLGVVVACVLAGAPAAAAGTLSKANGEYVFTEDAADTSNNVVVLYYCQSNECLGLGTGPGPYFLVGDTGDAIADGGHGCAPTADPNYLKCSDTSVTAWRLSLGAGNDQVLPQNTAPFPVPLKVDGGAGSDFLTGGPQADSLAGGAAGDTLNGLGGDDLLDGGLDSDTLDGGAGSDAVTYAGRSLGVSVDLGASGGDDGSSEDGAAGSRDTNSDVENVVGGAGADDLRGTAAANLLDGGAGDDTLNALAGSDVLLGGSGVDNVQARDRETDSVDCGPDDDAATTDAIDTRANCDPPAPAAPSGGGTTIVDNTRPSRVALDLAFTFNAGRRSTTLRDLFAQGEPGGRLTVTCRTAKRKPCARTRAFSRGMSSRGVRLRGFERKPLPVGAKLELRLTKDGLVGVVKTLTIRRRKAPSITTRCLPPGASRPAAC